MESSMTATQSEILKWLNNHHVFFKKLNERPWGSYEPGVSYDQSAWLGFPDTYGWGFSLEHAVSEMIIKFIDDQNLKNWIRSGHPSSDDSRYNQLREIVHGCNHDVQGDSDSDGARLHVLPEQSGDTPEAPNDTGTVLDQ